MLKELSGMRCGQFTLFDFLYRLSVTHYLVTDSFIEGVRYAKEPFHLYWVYQLADKAEILELQR